MEVSQASRWASEELSRDSAYVKDFVEDMPLCIVSSFTSTWSIVLYFMTPLITRRGEICLTKIFHILEIPDALLYI